jgi:hypothetical protein
VVNLSTSTRHIDQHNEQKYADTFYSQNQHLNTKDEHFLFGTEYLFMNCANEMRTVCTVVTSYLVATLGSALAFMYHLGTSLLLSLC